MHTAHLLVKFKAGALVTLNPGCDEQFIVQVRRCMVTGLSTMDYKKRTKLRQLVLVKAKLAQVLAARPFHKLQAVDVIHYPTGLRIFAITPYRQAQLAVSHCCCPVPASLVPAGQSANKHVWLPCALLVCA